MNQIKQLIKTAIDNRHIDGDKYIKALKRQYPIEFKEVCKNDNINSIYALHDDNLFKIKEKRND